MLMPWLDIRTTKTALQFLVPMFIFSLQFYPKTAITLTQGVHYVMHKCEKSNATYIAGTTFESTLNNTLYSILPATALRATFGNYTNGTGIDEVNAFFYCRGNVDLSVCHDCVQAASGKITKQCQFQKEAIVWYEECTLRYANRSILSIDEEDPVYIYTNSSGIINDDLLDPFTDEFGSAMAELIDQAANSRKLQGFATSQLNISSTEDLHFAVQCSPDISGVACQRCLNSALKQRDKWADTMIFMPSCFIRVDLYNSTAPPESISKGSKGLPTIVIVVNALVSAIVVIVAVAVVVFRYLHYYPDLQAIKTAIIAMPSAVAATVFCYVPNPNLEGLKKLQKFTKAELKQATTNFTNEIGRGGFAIVYRGTLEDEREVAVKRLKRRIYHDGHDFLSELNNNSCAIHRNIVKVIGYCNQGSCKLLVYEFLPNNCLHKHLHGTGFELLSWERRMKIAKGTARGLRYLHDECTHSIIHRDIKSANILLDSDYEPKLADFGLAKVFPDGVDYVATKVKGTLSYLDPAYDSSKKLTKKSDVYSFGIVLLEMITGREPRNLFEIGKTSLLLKALKEPKFGDIVDQRLNVEDNDVGMTRMIVCAAMSVHPPANCRLGMSQVAKLLEDGSLIAKDVAHIITYTGRRDLADLNKPMDLNELKILATQLLEIEHPVPSPMHIVNFPI